MRKSQKLSYLLRLLWKSPIFGDSYPSLVYEEETLLQMESVYACFVKTFLPILIEGMPHSSIAELNEIVGQVVPKSVAFCAAISAGEIEDMNRLCNVSIAIAISFWADQSMDRGDEAMLAAIRQIDAELRTNSGYIRPASNLVKARLNALRYIERLTHETSSHPEDLPYILRAIYQDVLANQAQIRDFSRQYLTEGGDPAFWDKHAEEVAKTTLANSGLMSAVTVIYSIYRYYQPDIPPLADIYKHPELMKLVQGPFNGAIRIFDDLGDRQIDTGQNPQWGIFSINLFNQPNIKFLDEFIKYSGVEDGVLRQDLISAFTRADSTSRLHVAKTYMNLLRGQIQDISPSLWDRYSVFLTLCKRTLEAGIVNSLGDILLSEHKDIDTVEMDILNLIVGFTGKLLAPQKTNKK